jgi:hypothetical protein
MQNNSNHHQPDKPIQAPPSLLNQVLGRIQQAEQAAEGTTHFATAFASPDWTLRVAAIEQLAHVEKEVALPWLERALSDAHPSVRAWAVHVLAQHQASELILPALHDSQWQVREAAILMLGIQDTQMSQDLLTQAQNDPDAAVSLAAQDVLRQQPFLPIHFGGKQYMKPADQAMQPFSAERRSYSLPEQRQRSEKMSARKQRGVSSVQRKRLPRLLGLAAAVFVSVALVGSMALVFSLLRGNAPSTGVGSHDPGAGVIGLVPTTTPIVHPECRDVQSAADEALCLQHKETILNITRTFGTHQVTFVRAYADISQLMLIYTTADSPHSDVISFESLTIQQKITLGGGSSHSYTNPQTHQEYYVLDFDTQSIPAGTTELHIQSIVDGFSGKATPLNFTLPLNMIQKTVSVNKTVTSKGVSLTLERLVIVGDTTLIYVELSSPQISSLFVDTISVNGHPLILPLIYNGGQTNSGGTVGSPAVAIRLDALLDAPGSWTLKVNEGGYTWTFSFAVPAN